MLALAYTVQYKKDYKRAKRQGRDLEKLERVLTELRLGHELPPECCDHWLSGNYKGHRECHIQPDWLLIYRIDKKLLILTAVRNGSHSELL